MEKLSERDRLALIVGGIISGLLLYYFLILSPLHDKNSQLVENNAQTRELIDWMSQAKPQLVHLREQTKNTSKSSESLLSAIEQSVKRNRLEAAAGDIKQLDTNRVQVSFGKVDFVSFMRWVEDIQSATACKIEKASIQKTDKLGMVHVDITLEKK